MKNPCQRILHITPSGEYVKTDKKKYNTLDIAIEVARKINLEGRNIHKMVAYKCHTCQKYHIGKNKTILRVDK